MLSDPGIKLLSLDVFDTLIGRRVPSPPDVFLRIGLLLKNKGMLINGIKPDSFAAIRYQTEHTARAKRQRSFGDREITLDEIYADLPPYIVYPQLSISDLVNLELKVEKEVIFANHEMVELVKHTKDKGLLLALISNTYLSKKALLDIIRTHAPSLPEPEAIFVSGENRLEKRKGLIREMCKHFDLGGPAVLHVGDNPISDKLAAEEAGILFYDYGVQPAGVDATFADEHPRQWHERTELFAQADGDFGSSWLRRQSSYWSPSVPVAENLMPFYRTGARLIGPLLNGFAAWAAQRMQQEGSATLFGLLREGDLLTKLVQKHDAKRNCNHLAISRIAAAQATFHPEYPHYLEDFLTRRGVWTVGMLIEQLGFDPARAKEIDDPQLPFEKIGAPELAKRIIHSSMTDELFEASTIRRNRIIKYLNSIGALDDEKMFILDLGYAATIQRNLQRVLKLENKSIITHGLYAVAVHVSLATQQEGGIVEGFMAQNGNPNDFSCAYGRSPEVIELFCLPEYGSVSGYDEDGLPLFQKETRPRQQIIETMAAQLGIEDYADQFIKLNDSMGTNQNYLDGSWAAQMRSLALRIIAHPTKQEADLISHWLTESEMGLSSPRPIVSAGSYEHAITSMSVKDFVSLPRREVPWLFGLAATLDYGLCRKTAQIIMRKETPEALEN